MIMAMRNIVWLVVCVATGCASLREEAQLKRQAESVVWGALQAPNVDEREHAARIAADVADPLLDRGLAARLADPAATVRATAAVALVRETPLAVEALRAILDGADAEAKIIAIDAVGALPDGKTRLAVLACDGDLRVRARAATAIAELKPDGARALLDQLLRDADPGVRGQALAGLALYGDRSALDEIAAALEDPSLGVRLAALGALVRLGRDAVGERLLALGSGRDRYVALRAAVQLSRLGRARAALPAVQSAADDRNPALRVAAMNAAGELGDAGGALAASHLRDPDLEVRLAAARALSTTRKGELAVPTLVGALATPRRLDAADELARLGDARGVAELKVAARAPDPRVRRVALALLGTLPAGHDALVAALHDPDPTVRLDAAGALLRRLLRTN
jgi:HEAT repeat protein